MSFSDSVSKNLHQISFIFIYNRGMKINTQPLNTDDNLINLTTLHVSIILRQQRERVGERCCTRPYHIKTTRRAAESQNHEMHDCDRGKIADQIWDDENPSFPTGGDGGTWAESGEQSAAAKLCEGGVEWEEEEDGWMKAAWSHDTRCLSQGREDSSSSPPWTALSVSTYPTLAHCCCWQRGLIIPPQPLLIFHLFKGHAVQPLPEQSNDEKPTQHLFKSAAKSSQVKLSRAKLS